MSKYALYNLHITCSDLTRKKPDSEWVSLKSTDLTNWSIFPHFSDSPDWTLCIIWECEFENRQIDIILAPFYSYVSHISTRCRRPYVSSIQTHTQWIDKVRYSHEAPLVLPPILTFSIELWYQNKLACSLEQQSELSIISYLFLIKIPCEDG